MPYRCREKECAKQFSVKIGTFMQGSKLDYQVWAVAMYLMVTGIKGVSSMKLHRDLEITRKSAWHLAHRIHEGLVSGDNPFSSPVEVDETFIGRKRKNMSNQKRKELEGTGRGAVGKTALVSIKDRETNEVQARVIDGTDAGTLQPFVSENVDGQATVYTDDHRGYHGLTYHHESVRHAVSEYVRDQAHTNGIEPHWAL